MTTHYIKNPSKCLCGKMTKFIDSALLTKKTSLTTCEDCLSILHKGFILVVKWRKNCCIIKIYEDLFCVNVIASGRLTLSAMLPFISDVFVSPEYRRLGFGSRIVRELVKRADRPSTLKAQPFTINKNDASIKEDDLFRFYEQIGFVNTGKNNHMLFRQEKTNE